MNKKFVKFRRKNIVSRKSKLKAHKLYCCDGKEKKNERTKKKQQN